MSGRGEPQGADGADAGGARRNEVVGGESAALPCERNDGGLRRKNGAAVRAGGEGEPEGDRECAAGAEGGEGEGERGVGGDYVCEWGGGGSVGGAERSVGEGEDEGAEEAGGREEVGCVHGGR